MNNTEFITHTSNALLSVAASTSIGEIHFAFNSNTNSPNRAVFEQVFRPVGGTYKVDAAATACATILPLGDGTGKRSLLTILYLNTGDSDASAVLKLTVRNNVGLVDKEYVYQVVPGASATVSVSFIAEA